ncbi:hypothetical protein [Schlesneria paludicola]|uniref:hypothetical protein n=1 Tax=Schlesneria paludicola TaxID=360056 RepID=UPI00029B4C01|nr:hypothetical protein [Schlesneria paludicola]
MYWLKRLLTPPLIVLASLLIWCEESIWIWLKRLTSLIAMVPMLRWLESRIVRLPPSIMLGIFFLPLVSLFPLKLLAVYWLTRGYWLASLTLIAAAKILGTAVVARMYVVCQPQLMSIAWFKWLHDWFTTTRDRMYSALHALPIYQRARALLLSIRLRAKRLLKRIKGPRGIWFRWRAIQRWRRRQNSLPESRKSIAGNDST